MKPLKVFVTVGTGWFDELIRAVDELPVTAKMQIGSGTYIPRNHPSFRHAHDLTPYYCWADLVIAHGGTATVCEVLRLGKKLIGVPNPHYTNNHQVQILKELSRKGYLVHCPRPEQVAQCIERALHTEFAAYTPMKCTIPDILKEWLDGLKT